ncbi:MAG: hypothetical protein ACRC4M_02645 [Mycoplasma sp.]
MGFWKWVVKIGLIPFKAVTFTVFKILSIVMSIVLFGAWLANWVVGSVFYFLFIQWIIEKDEDTFQNVFYWPLFLGCKMWEYTNDICEWLKDFEDYWF